MTTKDTLLKRANRKVEKLNEFIKQSIAECGGEHDIYLDNSSTCIGAPEHVEPNYNIKEDGHLYAGDNEICRAIYFEEEDGEWVEQLIKENHYTHKGDCYVCHSITDVYED